MTFYSPTASAHLYEQLEKARVQALDVAGDLIATQYSDLKAEEYAKHGAGRRIIMMMRCITNVFDLIPPENSNIPSSSSRESAEINIQTFILNSYDFLDNLAWILVFEKPILSKNGKPIDRQQIGFQNHIIQQHLSVETREYLTKASRWFVYLNEFRHSLAHRVPVYIPPFCVDGEGNKSFCPMMVHSFSESSGTIAFHGQMLSDFTTIVEIANLMQKEIMACHRAAHFGRS